MTARDFYGTVPNRNTAYLNGNVYTQRVWEAPYATAGGPPNPLSNTNSITTKYTYDTYGNQLTEAALDDNGVAELRKTTRVYEAVNGVDGLYVTQEKSGAGTELRSSTFVWDYHTGLRLSNADDQNPAIVQSFGYDLFGRPAGVTNANVQKSTRSFDDATLKVTNVADTRAFLDAGGR